MANYNMSIIAIFIIALTLEVTVAQNGTLGCAGVLRVLRPDWAAIDPKIIENTPDNICKTKTEFSHFN